MLRSYLNIALRSLHKNPVFSTINITGLTIGLVASILIGLWVADELSWDNFHVNKERLYRVYLNGKNDTGIFTQMAIPLPLWEEFKTNEPGIELVSPTNWGWSVLLTVGEKKLHRHTYFVGEDFLKMFSFDVVKGTDQLHDPSAIIITESTARDLFGNDDPIGKVVRVSNTVDLTVSGVVKDPPLNSSFKFSCLLPFQVYINIDPGVKRSLTNWNNNSYNLYVQFREGADPREIEDRVRNVVKKNSVEQTDFEVTFLKMDRWHLYDEREKFHWRYRVREDLFNSCNLHSCHSVHKLYEPCHGQITTSCEGSWHPEKHRVHKERPYHPILDRNDVDGCTCLRNGHRDCRNTSSTLQCISGKAIKYRIQRNSDMDKRYCHHWCHGFDGWKLSGVLPFRISSCDRP
jgi:hypothetical protein